MVSPFFPLLPSLFQSGGNKWHPTESAPHSLSSPFPTEGGHNPQEVKPAASSASATPFTLQHGLLPRPLVGSKAIVYLTTQSSSRIFLSGAQIRLSRPPYVTRLGSGFTYQLLYDSGEQQSVFVSVARRDTPTKASRWSVERFMTQHRTTVLPAPHAMSRD